MNGWTNKSEPSAAQLAKLARQIQADHVKALFLDSITDPPAIERIASETGATIGGLSMVIRFPRLVAKRITTSAP